MPPERSLGGLSRPGKATMKDIFTYDKTFEGLLSAVFDAFTMKRFPDELYGHEDILPLLVKDIHRVEVTPEKPARVFAALCKKLSEEAVRCMLHTWLSELPGSEMSLFRYICKALRAPRSIENDMADPDVWETVRLRRKVGKEAERFLGFVRFQKSKDGVYFSSIAPKYNVLPLLSGKFAERFHDQQWIIYDLVRHYGVMYTPGGAPGVRAEGCSLQHAHLDGKQRGAPGVPDKVCSACGGGVFKEIFMDERRLNGGFLPESELADGEMLLAEMWRGYYDSASIKERCNPRLQQNFMPKRFWAYLTEKRGPAGQKPSGGAGGHAPEADLL